LGVRLQRDITGLINQIKSLIPKLFEGKEYNQRKQAILQGMQQELDKALNSLKEDANKAGFLMKSSQEGIIFIPVKDGKPLLQEQYLALPEEERKSLEENLKLLQSRTEEIALNGKEFEKDAERVVQKLNRELVQELIKPLIQPIKEQYKDYPRIVSHLEQLLEDMSDNANIFGDKEESEEGLCQCLDQLKNYHVNLLVNNSETAGAPVVVETNPHYYNLFGKVEYRSQMGTVNTDFTMIKPGAIHRANGGYLILQVKDLLADPHSWDALKKALKNRQVTVENIGEHYRSVPTTSLKPEPIPLNVKVILVGSSQIYHLLHQVDEDFQKLFKVMVDFEVVMPRTPENLKNYAAFVGSVCRREGLPHFDRSGLAEIIEYGSRLAANQHKLSTQFNEVVEVIFEAAAWPRRPVPNMFRTNLCGRLSVRRSTVPAGWRNGCRN